MNVKKAVPALLAAAALAAAAATVASADSGPAPQPAPPVQQQQQGQQGGQGQRAQARQQRLEQLRQRLQQQRDALQQRRQQFREALQRREQQLREAMQQRQQTRGQGVAAQEQAVVQRLLGRRGGQGGIRFRFAGELTAASAGSVSLKVEGGNHPALVRLAGKSAAQTFAVGEQTEVLAWTDGVPKVVDASALKTGDWVVVNVRAPRAAGLDRIEQQPAGIVSDLGSQPNPPDEPLYLFRGKLVATGSSSLTVDVNTGNDRALRLLVGADDVQTFATGSETIFLLWQGKVPTVVSLADLKPGDSVTVRIRAKAGSDLAAVTSTAAVHVGEHEPANAQSGV